jgi:Arc/MetJ-type ribon-helix-helix transcriptional regulator
MKYDHELGKNRAKRAREPVQVYLDPPDRKRLERLTSEMETTKSDVLRRALEALERELLDPEQHPALQIIGVAGAREGREGDIDVARDHDLYLADLEDRRVSTKRTGGG